VRGPGCGPANRTTAPDWATMNSISSSDSAGLAVTRMVPAYAAPSWISGHAAVLRPQTTTRSPGVTPQAIRARDRRASDRSSAYVRRSPGDVDERGAAVETRRDRARADRGSPRRPAASAHRGPTAAGGRGCWYRRPRRGSRAVDQHRRHREGVRAADTDRARDETKAAAPLASRSTCRRRRLRPRPSRRSQAPVLCPVATATASGRRPRPRISSRTRDLPARPARAYWPAAAVARTANHRVPAGPCRTPRCTAGPVGGQTARRPAHTSPPRRLRVASIAARVPTSTHSRTRALTAGDWHRDERPSPRRAPAATPGPRIHLRPRSRPKRPIGRTSMRSMSAVVPPRSPRGGCRRPVSEDEQVACGTSSEPW
jgi:hypothetical protein